MAASVDFGLLTVTSFLYLSDESIWVILLVAWTNIFVSISLTFFIIVTQMMSDDRQKKSL
jgi:hypothetical protein